MLNPNLIVWLITRNDIEIDHVQNTNRRLVIINERILMSLIFFYSRLHTDAMFCNFWLVRLMVLALHTWYIAWIYNGES